MIKRTLSRAFEILLGALYILIGVFSVLAYFGLAILIMTAPVILIMYAYSKIFN